MASEVVPALYPQLTDAERDKVVRASYGSEMEFSLAWREVMDGRIAALVALCEELLDELEEVATGKRLDADDYRERLAKLKGAG